MGCSDGSVITCKARGVFRKDNIVPCIGDLVTVNDGEAAIEEIHPRKNVLVRPPAANVDYLGIVLSAEKPYPDLLLADKLTVTAYFMNVTPFIVINKCDLAKPERIAALQAHFEGTGIEVILCSCRDDAGIDSVRACLKPGVTVFAGQSGVGKSSVLGRLIPQAALEVGDLSRKSGRGKHTTRHIELHDLGEGRLVADTPGFSSYETQAPKREEIARYFPEFRAFDKKCAFNTCQHDREPNCAVKKALAEGTVSKGRYENYLKILEEMKNKDKFEPRAAAKKGG